MKTEEKPVRLKTLPLMGLVFKIHAGLPTLPDQTSGPPSQVGLGPRRGGGSDLFVCRTQKLFPKKDQTIISKSNQTRNLCIDCKKNPRQTKRSKLYKKLCRTCARKIINKQNWERNREKLLAKQQQKRAQQPGYAERAAKREANRIAKRSVHCAFCGRSAPSGKFCNRLCQRGATVYKARGLEVPASRISNSLRENRR